MGTPGGRFSGMESIFSGFVLDPAKCSELSLQEKRELVYEISEWSKNAPEILQSWSRRELLQIICAEMGKERKYTGVTKIKMIEHLLRLVSEKKSSKGTDDTLSPVSVTKNQNGSKRHKKKENSVQLVGESAHVSLEIDGEEQNNALLCQNLACKALLSPEDAFCKRCSCCICYHYDENKDPSLWLVCNSDPPNVGDSCGMSCHLTCALKHDRAGIAKSGCCTKLDGCFYCVSCGKMNSLMGSWRKQLLIAKDARRVDVLCCRISFSYKILKGTEQYKELQKMVNLAARKLKKEVGPLERVSARMARGIVNRLQCGTEVQKLCALAVEAFDSMLSGRQEPFPGADPKAPAILNIAPSGCLIHFEDISPVSVVVVLDFEDKLFEDIIGCRLWHRKSTTTAYPEEPTCIILKPETRFLISGLDPSTEYLFKVSPFSCTTEFGEWEACSVTQTPSGSYRNFPSLCSDKACIPRDLVADLNEENGAVERALIIETDSQKDSTNSSDNNQVPKLLKSAHHNHSKLRLLEEISNEYECQLPPSTEGLHIVHCNSIPPTAPCKSEGVNEESDSGNKKQMMEREYEYSVKVIRWLECEGHIEKEFRVKFLTWFSLKATMQDRRIVSAFIDTLIDDPPSLAGQLVDAFMEWMSSKEKPVLTNGLCTRLWH